jgi:ribosomal protein S18 acetylase RimI-like enzyme
MKDPDRTVRKASPQDTSAVAAILGDAFGDDPVLAWIVPDDQRRHAGLDRYFLALTRHFYLPHHEVYLTEGASGAALWLPPGISSGSVFTPAMIPILWYLYRSAGLAGLRRADQISSALLAQHPPQPHYYLHAIGVRHDRQGHGAGSALLRHMTERCDREGAQAYLESSNARNIPLYERYGFRVTHEWRANGGPSLWPMFREPQK